MNTLRITLTGLLLGALPAYLSAGPPTPDFLRSQVQAHLRIDVDKETDTVHFISTDNDPYIHTKTYVLKHADPYEIRPYLREAVGAERISAGTSKVECIKYNDGTGVLIVSAEDYRFEPREGQMSISEVIEMLDQPQITSAGDFSTYVYFPKYWDATSLRTLIANVGANVAADLTELDGGADRFVAESDLNAILFYVPPYSRKNIARMLELYDTPTAEVDIQYALYEIDTENDAKLGADFQAWKNGEGSRAMTLGARHRDGWNTTWDAGVSKTKSSDTSYVNLSPQWNSRYLDFLMAKGKARTVTRGNIAVANSQTGVISKTTNIFGIVDGDPIAAGLIQNEYMVFNDQQFVTFDVATGGLAGGEIRILAFDSEGKQIDFSTNFVGKVAMARIGNGNVTTFSLNIVNKTIAFHKEGGDIGRTARAFALVVQAWDIGLGEWVEVADWNTANNIDVPRDVQRNVEALALDSAVTSLPGYGFRMEVAPVVSAKTTRLRVLLQNDSLVGFEDNGAPRITSASTVETEVMLNNEGKTFFIGGLEKRTVVKSVSKVPYLGDLPVIGWALSSESETTKKAQLVLVMSVVPVIPEEKVPSGALGDIMKIKEATADAGTMNNYRNYGYDQFLIDDKKKQLDPLP
jgi:hypothetical protein